MMKEDTTIGESVSNLRQYSQILEFREKVQKLPGGFIYDKGKKYLQVVEQHWDEFIKYSKVAIERGDETILIDTINYHLASYLNAISIVKKICEEWFKKGNDSGHEIVGLGDSQGNTLLIVAEKIQNES